MSKKKTHEEFLKDVKNIHNDEFEILGNYINNSTYIKVKHKCGYEYETLPCNLLAGYKCPKCSNRIKKSLIDVKELLYSRLDDTYDIISTEYINNSTPIEFIHKKCNTIFKLSYEKLKTNKHVGCPVCLNNISNSLTNDIFIKKVKLKYNGEYTPLSEYKSIHDHVLMRHEKCGYEWNITPNNFLNKNRKCPNCYKPKQKTTEIFKKEIYTLYKDEYSLLSDYKSCNTKVLIRHNICNHEWKITPNDFLRGKKCPYCNLHKNQSKNESLIESYLINGDIKYEREKTFKTLKDKKSLRFDFYLPDYNLIIEYDGSQHEKAGWYKDEEKFSTTQKHDQMKNKWCKENNIGILRISYKDKDPIKVLDEYLNDNYEIIEE